jgi:hypothetical protein
MLTIRPGYGTLRAKTLAASNVIRITAILAILRGLWINYRMHRLLCEDAVVTGCIDDPMSVEMDFSPQ